MELDNKIEFHKQVHGIFFNIKNQWFLTTVFILAVQRRATHMRFMSQSYADLFRALKRMCSAQVFSLRCLAFFLWSQDRLSYILKSDITLRPTSFYRTAMENSVDKLEKTIIGVRKKLAKKKVLGGSGEWFVLLRKRCAYTLHLARMTICQKYDKLSVYYRHTDINSSALAKVCPQPQLHA